MCPAVFIMREPLLLEPLPGVSYCYGPGMVLVNLTSFEKQDSMMFQHQRSSVNSGMASWGAGKGQRKRGTPSSPREEKGLDRCLQHLVQLLCKRMLLEVFRMANAHDEVLVLRSASGLATPTLTTPDPKELLSHLPSTDLSCLLF